MNLPLEYHQQMSKLLRQINHHSKMMDAYATTYLLSSDERSRRKGLGHYARMMHLSKKSSRLYIMYHRKGQPT